MNETIKKELTEFKKYHKNIYNIYFHILCGFIFMAVLVLLSSNYSNLVLFMYALLLLFTLHDFVITLIISIGVFGMSYIIKGYIVRKIFLFLFFIVFYFLPDLSHYLTDEPSMLNINNITPLNLFTNIFYLLPFSIMSI